MEEIIYWINTGYQIYAQNYDPVKLNKDMLNMT